jgi:hypothetical protein
MFDVRTRTTQMPKHTIIVTAFKPFHRGTLRGFANIYVAELHMSIRDLAIHEGASGARWVQPPAKPLIDSDGNVQRTSDGRIQNALIFNFDDRATSQAFSAAVCGALSRFNPDAFTETADAGSET